MAISISALAREETRLVARIWSAAHAARRPDVMYDAQRTETLIAARVADPSAWFLAAFECATPVGVVHGLAARDADGVLDSTVPGLMHLSMLAVIPTHWGAGIGRFLLQHALAKARAHCYTAVQLWAVTDNARAIRLYRAAGFVPSGREKRDDRGEQIAHFHRDL